MRHIGHTILADRQYGDPAEITRNNLGGSGEDVLIARQALHAHRLTFDHPTTGERMTFEAPLPDDMQSVLEELRS